VLGPDGQPLGMTPPETLPVIPNPKARKNKVMGKNYAGKANAMSGAHGLTSRYHIVWGDTLWALARKNHTTISAIVKAQPGQDHRPEQDLGRRHDQHARSLSLPSPPQCPLPALRRRSCA